jgi:hypothetical protein
VATKFCEPVTAITEVDPVPESRVMVPTVTPELVMTTVPCGAIPAPVTVTAKFSVFPSTGAVGVRTSCVTEAAWVTVIDPKAELACWN